MLKPFSDRELHVAIQVSIERYEHKILLKRNEEYLRLALEAPRLSTWELKEASNEIFMGRSQEGNIEQMLDWKNFFLRIDENDRKKVSNFISKLRNKKDTAGEIEFRIISNTKKPFGINCMVNHLRIAP